MSAKPLLAAGGKNARDSRMIRPAVYPVIYPDGYLVWVTNARHKADEAMVPVLKMFPVNSQPPSLLCIERLLRSRHPRE